MEYRLSIKNMHCASCVASIESALKNVIGVRSVTVNFATKQAEVEGDVDLQKLIEVIKQQGYEASFMADEDLETDESKIYFCDLVKKASVAAIVGVPLMINEFWQWLPSLRVQWLWVIIGLLCLFVLYYSGGNIYRNAWQSFLKRRANMDTLVAMGTGIAWLYSFIVVISIPGISFTRDVYFGTSTILISFITFGAALEVRARRKTFDAIRHLMDLSPKTARVVRDNHEIDIPVEDVQVGVLLRVRPGEKIPVDGIVVEGSSQINESMLTGEWMPITKKKDDEVIGGTINISGSFIYRVTRVKKDSVLAQILAFVRQAQNSKPKISRIVDKVSAIFVPAVIIISILTAIAWFDFVPESWPVFILVTSVSVLVVACPCALGLATPISIIIGIGKAAEMGSLVRNGEALEMASQLTTIVLDKTGTITTGKPVVVDVKTLHKLDETELLKIAASVEKGSEHPLAGAILEAAKKRDISLSRQVDGFETILGQGVKAKVNGMSVLLGNLKLMERENVVLNNASHYAKQMSNKGQTPVYLALGGEIVGLFSIADPVKPDSKKVLSILRQMGLKLIMVTGDNLITAKVVAQSVGIQEVIAGVLPEDKVGKLKKLQQAGEKVAMVGDGINDAPALATADVGFAIGSGTDVALESADITLVGGSLLGVVNTIAISKATLRNIKQNLFGAFFYNILGIPIAAGVFYPLVGVLLSPIIAGAAMALSSVVVVANANRLRFFRKQY